MEKTQQIAIQSKLFDFALSELVQSHRESFKPLWTVDSWVKFLIWMALNCGLSGEQDSLELFAQSLGPPLTSRMRRIFFQRTLDDLSLCVMADPAEKQILILPINGKVKILMEESYQALELIGLSENFVDFQHNWDESNGVISIPWNSSESKR